MISDPLETSHPGDGGFTVKNVAGCRLVYGPIPVSELAMLTHGMSKRAQADFDMASRIGATMVIGEPKALEALRQLNLPVSEARRREAQAARDAGLPAVAAWLLEGRRGASSNAMCRRFFGIPGGAGIDHPHDPSDLRRCIDFLDATGSHDKLPRMADVSEPWSRLVGAWDLLRDSLHSEHASAPNTYALMKSVLANRGICANL